MKNNRKFERYDLVLSVSVKDKSGVRPAKTGNISRFGLFLQTENPKPIRQLIQLVIEFPHAKESIDALAQVMWADLDGSSERSGGKPGMGVKFFSMPDRDKRRWETFVDDVRMGNIVPGEAPVKEKPATTKSAVNDKSGVHVIGEEELDELEEIDIGEIEDELSDDGEIIDIEEEDEPLSGAVQDLSAALEEYEKEQDAPESVSGGEVERREFPRKDVAFLVKLENVKAMRDLYSRDISLGGMFLVTEMEKKIGDIINVIIVHPWTENEFLLQASVERLEKDKDGAVDGLGVAFLNMDDPLRDSLLTFIESGYVISRPAEDVPIESAVIRRIEEVENAIKQNPIDNSLHFEVGLLYMCLSDWEKSNEHLDIAAKLGYVVPEDILSRLQDKL